MRLRVHRGIDAASDRLRCSLLEVGPTDLQPSCEEFADGLQAHCRQG